MYALLEIYLDQFLVFVLVLTRISGLMMTAPIYGSSNVPMRVRAFLAVGISALIMPIHWQQAIEMPENLLALAIMMGHEAALGLALGLAVMILFTGLQLTGQIVGQMSGMQLADVFDPTFNTSVPVFSQLLNLVATSVFVCLGGHRHVMRALLDTFQWSPPGQAAYSPRLTDALVEVTAMSFSVGIRVAAPVMVALLMAVLIMGLISRTLPQLNVLAVGFSVNTVVMMATLAISLGTLGWIFQDHVDEALAAVRAAFAAPPV